MAIPPNAKALPQPMDPADILDWSFPLTQDGSTDEQFPLLAAGETIDTFTLTLSAEAVALGLIVLDGAYKGSTYPGPTLSGLIVTFWLAVDDSAQGSAAFNGAGVTLGLEFTGWTTNTPRRRKQRSATVTIANQ